MSGEGFTLMLDKVVLYGKFGTIWEASKETDPQQVHAKIMDLRTVEGRRAAYRLLVFKDCLRHSRVTNVLEAYDAKNEIILVSASEGWTIPEILDAHKDEALPTARIVFELLQAVKYLHDAAVVHNEICLKSVTLSPTGRVKLRNFEAAVTLKTPIPTLAYTRPDDYSFIAPEIMFGQRFSSARSDMWSVGCFIAYMLKKKLAFSNKSMRETLKDIVWNIGLPTREEFRDLHLPKSIIEFRPGKYLKRNLPKEMFRGVEIVMVETLRYDRTSRMTARTAVHQFSVRYKMERSAEFFMCGCCADTMMSDDQMEEALQDQREGLRRIHQRKFYTDEEQNSSSSA
ncbi:unnamed protein product [Notodromas monacha]|uniref:Protein kinase domain-containing protein n=1 Tax=Notodromas monacha TaxID=399045 RepID=A0A7R9GAP0_9CRUS|nr:unnamed protein product [Notodromas monacha]CAG0914225.1 unnamed protein product [Notodromas monacha]